MYVDEETFEKLFATKQLKDFGVARAPVVSPEHLVTLKIHALKHYQGYRYARDFTDIVSLLRLLETKISKEELRARCERYAEAAFLDKLQAELEHE